jgi:hypothetical protein
MVSSEPFKQDCLYCITVVQYERKYVLLYLVTESVTCAQQRHTVLHLFYYYVSIKSRIKVLVYSVQ